MRVAAPGLKPSFAIIPGIRQVNQARLHDLVGQTGAAVMARLNEAIALYLGA